MTITKTRESGEQGQMMVMFALLLVVLIGFVAMTIDVGFAFVERRNLQSAVDAAALAGAQDFANGQSEATATATAIDYLQRNGYNSVDDAIEVNIPPTSGAYAGLSGYVTRPSTSGVPQPISVGTDAGGGSDPPPPTGVPSATARALGLNGPSMNRARNAIGASELAVTST